MSAPASVVDEPKTAVLWLTERLVEYANARIDRTIERRAQEAIDRLYRMHSGPSGVCQCGSSSVSHPIIDDHMAVDIPIDKAFAIEEHNA